MRQSLVVHENLPKTAPLQETLLKLGKVTKKQLKPENIRIYYEAIKTIRTIKIHRASHL